MKMRLAPSQRVSPRAYFSLTWSRKVRYSQGVRSKFTTDPTCGCHNGRGQQSMRETGKGEGWRFPTTDPPLEPISREKERGRHRMRAFFAPFFGDCALFIPARW